MIRQPLTLEGGYPDGEWRCADCDGAIVTGRDHRPALEHKAGCAFIALVTAGAVSAERERIRKLAVEHMATCYVPCPDLASCKRGVPHEADFADLLDGGTDD